MKPGIALDHRLPRRALGALVRLATRWRWRPWKNALIRLFVRRYGVDLAEAASADPADYVHFDAFFTRALKPGARVPDPAADALLCPADGRISQAGTVRDGRIVQAKGREYTVAELLTDAQAAACYDGGCFLNIYLSPRDYHRVHMPCHGRLAETLHVPGTLFSVAPQAVAGIDRLFARNERLVCHFEDGAGPFAVVMVGALLVSGISTVWAGTVAPPHARGLRRRRHDGPRLQRGAELGRFHMGSTVIVLLPPGRALLDAGLRPQQPVRVGMRLGRMLSPL